MLAHLAPWEESRTYLHENSFFVYNFTTVIYYIVRTCVLFVVFLAKYFTV